MQPAACIHVIGLGVREQAHLTPETLSALQHCNLVIGSQRQLDSMEPLLQSVSHPVERVVLPKLPELKALLSTATGIVAVLASGDPLFFGIGRWLGEQFPAMTLRFHPAVSSIQMACHRLGLSLQDVTVLSLHGRPLTSLRRALQSGTTLVILTDQHSHPIALAQECIQAGFNDSLITVCEDLGYSQDRQERIRTFSVLDLASLALSECSTSIPTFSPLHISVIQVKGKGGVLPQFPGFPDTDFSTGTTAGSGMISKREVRLQILSYLQPGPGDCIWDVGAGCGGVAVELAWWTPRAQVYAIEQHDDRIKHLQTNQQRFGVEDNLHIVHGRAPECLATLPAPDKVFIGGSDGELSDLLNLVWQMLPVNGVLVASAVLDRTRQQLSEFALHLSNKLNSKPYDGDAGAQVTCARIESCELQVQRGTFQFHSENASEWQYQSKKPVEIFQFIKTATTKGQE